MNKITKRRVQLNLPRAVIKDLKMKALDAGLSLSAFITERLSDVKIEEGEVVEE